MLVRGASSWLIVERRTVTVLLHWQGQRRRARGFYQSGPRVGALCHTTRVPLSVVVNQKPSMHCYSTVT